MNSLLGDQITSNLEELPPRSSAPWVWFGLVLAVLLFVCELLAGLLDLERERFSLLLLLMLVGSWIFWLFCVARFHTILREISRNQYPVSAPEAVGKYFIPFYNLYWIFRWPAVFSEYINSRGRVSMVSGYALGLIFLAAVLIQRFVDSSLGLMATFCVGLYLSAKLRRHIEMIKGPNPDLLPPLPDANMWGATGHSDK